MGSGARGGMGGALRVRAEETVILGAAATPHP